MKKEQYQFTMVALIAPLVFNGCASMDNHEQSQSYSIQGCVVGGLGGGVLAFLKYGGDSDKIAIATALGCMGGAIVGYSIGKRTEEYADAQQAAREEISRNKQHTEELRQVNNRLKENIADYNQQIQNIESSTFDAREKQEKKQEIKKYVSEQLDKTQKSLAQIKAELVASNKEFQDFQEETNPEERKVWQAQIENLEREKEILSGHVSTLNALDSSI